MGFRKVITKSRIVGLLTILVVGFLVLRTGDEPPDSGDREGGRESATDRQRQPREPAFLTPSREYGIARQSGADSTPAPYGKPESFRQEPYPEFYSGGYRTPDPYGRDARTAADGYRFRPLSEQEQRRIRERYPEQYLGQYAAPYNPPPQAYPSPESQPVPGTPAPYSTPYSSPGAYSDPRQGAYSFRPLEEPHGTQGRWQGPYQEPGQRYDGYPADPWTAPPPPQWGSTPPAQRMYPNLNRNPGNWITAR